MPGVSAAPAGPRLSAYERGWPATRRLKIFVLRNRPNRVSRMAGPAASHLAVNAANPASTVRAFSGTWIGAPRAARVEAANRAASVVAASPAEPFRKVRLDTVIVLARARSTHVDEAFSVRRGNPGCRQGFALAQASSGQE